MEAQKNPKRLTKEKRYSKKKRHVKEKHSSSSYHSRVNRFIKLLTAKCFFDFMTLPLVLSSTPTTEQKLAKRDHMRGMVREVLGTQQPIIRCRTGGSNLTTNGSSVLPTVIQMDVTGIASWSSFAALFDEYRVRKAHLHVLPTFMGSTTVIGTGTPTVQFIRVAVDYDDATAISSSTAALQYDAAINFPLGSANPKEWLLTALPEGQPDLAWVTTATPTVPFWFKFYNLSTGLTASANVGIAYIECDVEFRALG
jgi:hypothetical protein